MQKGEIEPAIKDFEAVLILDPDNVNAALQKASCINLKVSSNQPKRCEPAASQLTNSPLNHIKEVSQNLV